MEASDSWDSEEEKPDKKCHAGINNCTPQTDINRQASTFAKPSLMRHTWETLRNNAIQYTIQPPKEKPRETYRFAWAHPLVADKLPETVQRESNKCCCSQSTSPTPLKQPRKPWIKPNLVPQIIQMWRDRLTMPWTVLAGRPGGGVEPGPCHPKTKFVLFCSESVNCFQTCFIVHIAWNSGSLGYFLCKDLLMREIPRPHSYYLLLIYTLWHLLAKSS